MNRTSQRWLTLLLIAILCSVTFAQDRKIGTIGPPPRQSPQRETAAESVPPLPLPATPMRRSEPKAEPSPPLFVGRLIYGQTQDYMPNPGDLDNLLRHVRSQLDAWYGHELFGLDELVKLHEAGTPCQIPMLYMTGYQAFEFTPAQRNALREYLLDGGTLVADATLGSPAFTDSLQTELAQMFPDRRLEPLQTDHPVYRGYYQYRDVNYFTISQGTHTRFQSPPQMLGLNLAARTAVIFSPYDLTCGWDEFYAPPAEVKVPNAPRTMAMMPSDAIRMGINIIAYVTAQRRFAKTQAVTREIVGEQPQHRAAVPVALLRHQGDWNADPNSIYQLIRLTALKTSVPVDYEIKTVDATPQQLVDAHLLIMTGMTEPMLSNTEVLALQRHLQAGGVLFINNTSGFARFDKQARILIERLAPGQPLVQAPPDHKLFHGLYQITQMRDAGTLQPRVPELEIVEIGQRACIIYSRNDTLGMLKGIHDPYANAYDADSARKLALNILCYAMQP